MCTATMVACLCAGAPPVHAAAVSDVDNAVESNVLTDLVITGDQEQILRTIGVLTDLPAPLFAVAASLYDGPPLISGVIVATTPEGTRFLVAPTAAMVRAPHQARYAAWREAMAHGVPDTPSVRHQFYCHYDAKALLAGKPTWNLEAYRPDVGYADFVTSWCN